MAVYKIGSVNVSSFCKLERRIEIGRYCAQNKYDLVLVQETKLKVKHTCVDSRYNFYREDDGGTLIMARKGIKCTQIKLNNLDKVKCTCISIKGKGGDIIVISIYIPCASNLTDILHDLDEISKWLRDRPCIIGGDLNTSPTQHKHIMNWINLNNINYKLISPDGPTFRTGSTLDHFILSAGIVSSDFCKTTDLYLEHKLITLSASLKHFQEEDEIEEKIRKWHLADWRFFRELLTVTQRTFVPNTNNITNEEIDAMVRSFTEEIIEAVDGTVPMGKRGVNRIWMIPDSVDRLYRERRRLKKQLQRAKGHWIEDVDRIANIRRSINQATGLIQAEINNARESEIERKIQQVNEGRNAWKTIKSLSTVSNKPKQLLLNDQAGKAVSTAVEKQSVLSAFYGELYRSVIPPCSQLDEVVDWSSDVSAGGPITQFTYSNKSMNPSGRQFVCYMDVIDFIKRIPIKYSTGDDNISNFLIKKLPQASIETLTRIINHCINNCYFPVPWKTAVVVTIPKKAGRCSPGELRPISLTSNLGKILEMVIMRNIERELKDGAIPDHQFGFRVGHSTVDALSVLTNYLDEQRGRGFTAAVCSLDVKKAFDTVWHEGILFKMDKAGCGIHSCQIVQSFLEDRKARIRVEGTLSSSFTIARGVPQGSRLGPLLFNVYMSDLPAVCDERGITLQYADDTLIVARGKSAKEAISRVNAKVLEVTKFMNNWGIELNEAKTDLILSKKRRKKLTAKNKKLKLKVGSAAITPKTTLKYLGVIIDMGGTFKEQAMVAAKKARAATGACWRLLKNKNLKLKIKSNIYKTLIRSRGAYGATVWFRDEFKEPLMVMERWAYRYALNHVRDPDTGHWPRNVQLYEEMGEKNLKFDEFVRKSKDKWEGKCENHLNRLVRRLKI